MTAHEKSVSTVSVWMDAARPVSRPLEDNRTADVCVIGAGIAGLTTAYLLAKEGVEVIVLDDGPIGGGETERTTAHLVTALDDRYMDLEKLHGREGAALAAQSHGNAIDMIERIVHEEKIACDFLRVDGHLMLTKGESEQLLRDELAAIHRAGLNDVELVAQTSFGALNVGPSVRFPRQAQFHPMKYLRGLADAIARMKGTIHTGTHVNAVHGGGDAYADCSGGHTVRAKHIVVATNAPINDSVRIYGQQTAYRTYVIAAAIPAGSLPSILLWDTGAYSKESKPVPYHYARVVHGDNGSDMFVVGGEDHRTGHEDDAPLRFGRLEQWARELFPATGDILYRWSGQVMEPADGLAMIGRNPGDKENAYIATGDSGNGMTHGTIAGMLLTDMIRGRKNPWEHLYDPKRVRLKAAKNVLKESAIVAKELASDWVRKGDIDSPDQLAPGSGGILHRRGKKIALYRDPKGHYIERSAICPHKGCVVRWNSLEHSWDCPCHGSRFTVDGTVVNGPSIKDLRPAPGKPA